MRVFLILFFTNIFLTAYSQPGPIKVFRYFDDFSYLLDNDSIDRKWFEKLKYMPLGKKIHLSLGGEVREMYQYFHHQNFGDTPPSFQTDSEGFLWHRVMAHADLKIGNRLRLFTQLNSTFTFFKQNPLSPQIDENQLSLHQAFIRWDFGKNQDSFLQIGRQEFGKGTQMIIGMREGPNTRLTFDAVLLGIEKERSSLYAFLATPNISKQGVFDDVWIDEFIWTLYLTQKLATTNLDIYYFGFHGSERAYSQESSIEDRQTIGLRFWAEKKIGLNYSLETIYQFGSFGKKSISSYNLSADIDYNFPTTSTFQIGLMANYISGDEDATDNKINTFNLLYSKPQFGLAAPIGSTNIINISPRIKYEFLPQTFLSLGNYWLWRESTQDGFYTPAATQIRPGNNSDNTLNGQYIGSQTFLELMYRVNVNLELFFDYVLFLPGAYIKQTGRGENIQYFSSKLAFKF